MADAIELPPSTIDWSVFDKYEAKDTCTCVCGARHRSDAKAVYAGKGLAGRGLWSREPCPACGNHRLQKISSDPEAWNIGKPDG